MDEYENIEDLDLEELDTEDLDLDDEDLEELDLDEETEEENLDEATEAANTLKPKGAPGESKAATLATFTALLAQLGKDDLSKIFNQVQDQYGPNKGPGAHGNQAPNTNSIKAKPSDAKGSGAIGAMSMPTLGIKEDVEELFSGDDLSEDLKERATAIFEAAVNTRTNLELVKLSEQYDELTEQLHAEYEEKLEESTNEILETLTQKLDHYLDFTVEEWKEDNKLAIESSIRADLAENFIHSLRNVFAEHYIEVPEERFDVMAEMRSELDELRSTMTETLDENLELKAQLMTLTRDALVDELAEGLSEAQSDKFRSLAEGLEYSDTETFQKKLGLIKENFVARKSTNTGLLNETIDGTDADTPQVLDEKMTKYVNAIK